MSLDQSSLSLLLGKKLAIAWAIALAVIGLLSGPALGLVIKSDDGGRGGVGQTVWTPSPSQSTMCNRAGKICAEWIVDQRIEWVCCLDPNTLYSTDLGACPNPRRPQY